MVVGDADSWSVLQRVSEGPAKLIELSQIVEDRRPGRIADDAVSAVIFVKFRNEKSRL